MLLSSLFLIREISPYDYLLVMTQHHSINQAYSNVFRFGEVGGRAKLYFSEKSLLPDYYILKVVGRFIFSISLTFRNVIGLYI